MNLQSERSRKANTTMIWKTLTVLSVFVIFLTPITAVRAEDAKKSPPKPTLEKGFVSLFDGKTHSGWQGATKGYVIENGVLVCQKGGNLFTKEQYADFIFRFEFKLPPGGNNGLGIRAPLKGDAAYLGMEIQILDDSAPKWKNLKPYQYHGSIYGVVPAKRGHLKKVGEWNFEEVTCQGTQVTVKLNGTTIVDADIEKAGTPKTLDGRAHPGLKRTTGHIGFLGHGAGIEFRNIRIKKL